MASLVSKRVAFAAPPARIHNSNARSAKCIPAAAINRLPLFIAWRRQVRCSAWILIGTCSLFRIGEVVSDVPNCATRRPSRRRGERSRRPHASGRKSPWSAPTDVIEIRMASPRSPLPVQGRYRLIAAAIAAALISLRFVLRGAWPVLIFSVPDIGALAAAACRRTELEHALWPVFRRERHRIGRCVSATERRALEPPIRPALEIARSRSA